VVVGVANGGQSICKKKPASVHPTSLTIEKLLWLLDSSSHRGCYRQHTLTGRSISTCYSSCTAIGADCQAASLASAVKPVSNEN